MEKSYWAHSTSLLPSAHNTARRPPSLLPQWAGIGSSLSVPAPALGRPSSAKHTPAPSPLSLSLTDARVPPIRYMRCLPHAATRYAPRPRRHLLAPALRG